MKKMMLSFLTILIVQTFCFAQTNANCFRTNLLKSLMVSTVCESKPYYSNQQTYDDFLKKLEVGKQNLSKQENEFLMEVFGFLKSKASDEMIYKSYVPKALETLMTPSPTKPTPPFSGVSAKAMRCRFLCKLGKILERWADTLKDTDCILQTGDPC